MNVKRKKPPKITDPKIIALRKDLAEKHSGIMLQSADETDYPFDLRRPTGIIGIDKEIGGGWPGGSMNQLFGPDGSGKNSIVNFTAAEIQTNYGEDARILMGSLGYGFDKTQARACGVKIRHSEKEIASFEAGLAAAGMEMTQAEYDELVEQPGIFQVMELNSIGMAADEAPTEKMLSALLDAIASDIYQLVVIDEAIGAGATKDMLAKDLGQNVQMADQARLLTQMVRKFFTAIKSRPNGRANETTVLIVSQTRMKLNPYEKGSGNYSLSGGQAVKHAKAIDIHVRSGKKLVEKDKVIGKELKWRVDKAKLGTYEGAEGVFNLYFEMENMHDPLTNLLAAAEDTGYIAKKGAWQFLLDVPGVDPALYEEHKSFDVPVIKLGMGSKGARKRLQEDVELQSCLAKALLSKIKRAWRVT